MAKRNKRDEPVFLEDILECIDRIKDYTKALTQEEFENNTEKQDAVLRRIEIIGEAARNISEETRTKYPSIRWREIAGMRDIAIHQYFGISMGLVWRVATNEVPELRATIDKMTKEIENRSK